MTGATGQLSEAVQIRFVEACPQCGYSLAGSPEEGNCPECGSHYDQSVMILHGAAMGNEADLGNASPRRLWLIVFWMIFQSMFMWFNVSMQRNLSIALLLMLVWLSPMLLLLARRWHNQRPGLIQVYLSPRGCLQVEDRTEPPAINVLWFLSIFAMSLVTVAWMITAASVAFTVVTMSIIFILIGIGWLRSRKTSGPATPIYQLRPAEALAAGGHPWTGDEDLSCEPTRRGHARLKIRAKSRWYKFQGDDIDAEISADAGRCAQIYKLVRGWMREAASQPANPS